MKLWIAVARHKLNVILQLYNQICDVIMTLLCYRQNKLPALFFWFARSLVRSLIFCSLVRLLARSLDFSLVFHYLHRVDSKSYKALIYRLVGR